MRDNAESIAFYDGEIKERSNLQAKFHAIIHNRWVIVRRMFVGIYYCLIKIGVFHVAIVHKEILQSATFLCRAGEIRRYAPNGASLQSAYAGVVFLPLVL